MELVKPYYVLGLDLGPASCGFALIDINNMRILEMGSHLFDAPQENKKQTKVSLAAKRRSARSARRNNQRTKNRQKHCIKLLREAKLIPQDASGVWFQTKKGDRPSLKLRDRGLEERLSDREFAQILYTLSARRGYIPHGEGKLGYSKESSDSDLGKVLKAVSENSNALSNGKSRTVGELLYERGSSRNTAGAYDHCVLNSQIVEEVHALFKAQRDFGNDKASEQLENDYIANLTWEKKTLDIDAASYARVGFCTYFEEEKRAARADYSSELCAAYERLGHLTIVDSDGTETRLDPSRRNRYLSILFSPKALPKNKYCKVRYSDIRRDLDLSSDSAFKGVEADQEKDKEPFEPKAWRCMRENGISENLLERMLSDRDFADAIGEALTYASTKDSLLNQLDTVDLTSAEKESIAGLPFSSKIFKGYGNRSLKALYMLLDAFEDPDILTLADAETATGLKGKRLADNYQRSAFLPLYEIYDNDCNNPVVLRAMSRMRRIVNAIIKIYGVPDEIHIELARELKQSKREKDAISKFQRKKEQANNRYREVAAGILNISPDEVSDRIIEKMAFREQQNDKDAYTGTTINLERLVTDSHYCQVDHVLPYSRTSDNSRNNRVLVLSTTNQNKRERTPFEWMNSGEANAPAWNDYKKHVLANKNYSQRKKQVYLLNENLDSETEAQFISRNLNDTRYMSRATMAFLADTLEYPDDGRKRHVIAVAGSATSALRHVWGLNFGEGNVKDRSDDRHHAVDACVIAACSESTLKKVARARSRGYRSFKKTQESRLSDTQPWPTFADDVIAMREKIVPTRMVSHGVTGRAFKDTNYKLLGLSGDKKFALLKANGKVAKEGNVVVGRDGNAHQVDGMAFLRLWLDPARNNGRGKWLAEPVYYADIPLMKNGSYVPKVAKVKTGRICWDSLPTALLSSEPLVIFRGDVLEVDGIRARFNSFHSNNCALVMNPLTVDGDISNFPTLGKWNKSTDVRIIQEDCLGHCYRK